MTQTIPCTPQTMALDEYVKKPPFVGLLQFETNTTCNGKCIFCNHKDLKTTEKASWTTLLEVIDNCVPYAQTVCPFIRQEPLLEPRLPAILDNIKQVNPRAKTQIYTNMAVLPEWWKQLIDEQNLDTVIVSFYGPTPQTYAKYQPGFNWHQTASNIRRFMAYRNSKGLSKPHVTMHMIMLPETVKYYDRFVKRWRSIVDAIGTTVYRTHAENDPCFKNQAEIESFERKLFGEPAKQRVPCGRIYGGFYVLSNGDVVPCSADWNGENVLGNIHKNDFYEIWWGQKAQDFRQKHVDGKQNEIEMCKNCNYWKYEQGKEWLEFWQKKQ